MTDVYHTINFIIYHVIFLGVAFPFNYLGFFCSEYVLPSVTPDLSLKIITLSSREFAIPMMACGTMAKIFQNVSVSY
jgi:hypothetical protein